MDVSLKKQLIVLAIVVILFPSILFVKYVNETRESFDYTIEITESETCGEKETLYYSDKTQKIYLSCLDEVKIKTKEDTIELKKYMEDQKMTVEDIRSFLLEKTSLKEEIIYSDGETKKYRNEEVSVIFCNHEISEKQSNRDIYIGPKYMKLEDHFCK